VEARKSVGINRCWTRILGMELLCKSILPKYVFILFPYQLCFSRFCKIFYTF